MDTNTIRILSLDGGGMRGYLPLTFFNLFIKQWGINPKEIWKYFDVICGTSIGSITGAAYAYGLSPDELAPFFTEKGKKVFTNRSVGSLICNTSTESNKPNIAQKLVYIADDNPFYASVKNPVPGVRCTDNNYGHVLLYKTIRELIGEAKLNELKTNVLFPVYEYDTQTYVPFSNVKNKHTRSGDFKVSDVILSSGAAPVYFPEYIFKGSNNDKENHNYIDGGVFYNNPAEAGLSLGKTLKPCANRFCVMSLGTGIGPLGFEDDPTTLKSFEKYLISSGLTLQAGETIMRIFELFNIASTGCQEAVHNNLAMRSEGGLEQLYYYRFQPKLDPKQDTELDSSKPEFLAYLKQVATDHYNNDKINIDNFLGHLTA